MLRTIRMHRLITLVICFMLVLSLGLGSVAHATEGATCVEASVGTSIDHSDGDSDQVPADADKAFPHHHGECHGHHIGIPIAVGSALPAPDRRVAVLADNDDARALAPSNADLRPPKA